MSALFIEDASMSELIEELFSRSQSCIVAFTQVGDGGEGRYDIRRHGCNLTLLGLGHAVGLAADTSFRQKMAEDEVV
jgi:hypothetical protein